MYVYPMKQAWNTHLQNTSSNAGAGRLGVLKIWVHIHNFP